MQKILIIEDDKVIARTLKSIFANGIMMRILLLTLKI